MSEAIVGIGRTAYTRASGRTTLAMAVDACRSAIADAGLKPEDVDGMVAYHVNDSTEPRAVAYAMGVDSLEWYAYLTGGGQMVAAAVATAAAAVQAGLCRAVLVYRSMNGRSGHRFGLASGRTAEGYEQFVAPQGYLVPPQHFSMWARRHQHVYGTTSEDLGAIAVQFREHASVNPHAIAQDPLTIEQYLDGRWISEPFRVYDCTFEVDGAVAVLVTGADVATGTAKKPVWLVDTVGSYGIGASAWDQWPNLAEMYSATAGPKLWSKTGLAPSDIDVACMYDCFTYTVMATMEGYGFCEPGQVGPWFREGRGTYGGDVVVNPHGGLLSEGYIHGLNHHYEAVLQLRNEAAHRQVPGAELALVTAGGGPWGGANIYSSQKP